MSTLHEENAELLRGTAILAQRLLGEVEQGGDITTIARIATLGGPIARVARNGGGYLEALEAMEARMEELDWRLSLRLARAGFGPEERMALLPQVRNKLLGRPRAIALPEGAESLPIGGG